MNDYIFQKMKQNILSFWSDIFSFFLFLSLFSGPIAGGQTY